MKWEREIFFYLFIYHKKFSYLKSLCLSSPGYTREYSLAKRIPVHPVFEPSIQRDLRRFSVRGSAYTFAIPDRVPGEDNETAM